MTAHAKINLSFNERITWANRPPPTPAILKRNPPQSKKPYSVNYTEGYYPELARSCYHKLAAFVLNFKYRLKPLASTRGFLRIKFRWEHIVIAFLLGLLFASRAQPAIIHNIEPASTVLSIKTLKPLPKLKTPVIQPVESLEIVWENKLRPYGTYGGADYVGGQCTFGVAQRLPIPPSWGNANQWPTSASYAGYGIGSAPKAGSVAVSYTDSWLGHVAAVESVNPDGSFVIWEMNGANGPFTTDTRVSTVAEFSVFIYI